MDKSSFCFVNLDWLQETLNGSDSNNNTKTPNDSKLEKKHLDFCRANRFVTLNPIWANDSLNFYSKFRRSRNTFFKRFSILILFLVTVFLLKHVADYWMDGSNISKN